MHSEDYLHRAVVDRHGARIGTVTSVDGAGADDASPQWITIATGGSARQQVLAPLTGAAVVDGDIVLGYTKAQVDGAPAAGNVLSLSDTDAARLSDYYGLTGSGLASTTAFPAGDIVVTRSEELLRVDVERVVSGVVKVSKYIVTEQVTQTVEVSHEEVRIVHEPSSVAGGPAEVQAETTGRDLDIVLYAEQLVITKTVVPVERVTIAVTTLTEQREVQATVGRERVTVTGAGPAATEEAAAPDSHLPAGHSA